MSTKQDKSKKRKMAKIPDAASGQPIGFGFGGATVQLELQMSDAFQLAFKKLSKKDSVTRYKGLEELKVLFENNLTPKSDEEKAVITRWINIWPSLVVYPEPKNRVMAVQAMSGLTTYLGRRLGNHLKSILPNWLLLTFDTQKSVQQASQQALSDAVPSNKYNDALMFCKADILETVNKNFNLNLQLLVSNSSVEEAEEKYERVVSASILLLNHLLPIIKEKLNSIQETTEKGQKLNTEISEFNNVLSQNFSKFYGSKFSLIRRSVFLLVKSLSVTLPELALSNLETLSPLVIGSVSDKDRETHGALWESLLHFAKAFPACWNHVNIKKQLLTPIFEMLRKGTYGSTSTVYPSILPLLSLLPVEVLQSDKLFQDQFLNSIWAGMDSEFINKSNLLELLNCYSECVLYSVLKLRTIDIEASQKLFSQFLVKFKSYLTYEKLEAESVATVFAQLVERLSSKTNCEVILKRFWESLLEGSKSGGVLYFSETSDVKDPKVSQLFCDRLVLFLNNLDPKKVTNEYFISFAKELYSSIPIACKYEADFQLDLVSKMIKKFGLELVEKENVHQFLPEKIFPWIRQWSKSKPKKLVHSFLICAAYFSTVLSVKGNDHTLPLKNWTTLLSIFEPSNHTMIFKLCEIVCVAIDDFTIWHHPTLDKIATDISNDLIDGKTNFHSAQLLSFLLSGHNYRELPLLSPSTLEDVCLKIKNTATKISKVSDHEMIFCILNVVHAVILSPGLPAPLHQVRIDLIKIVFEGRNSDDVTVKNAFSDLWDDVYQKLLSYQIMSADLISESIFKPAIEILWTTAQKNNLNQDQISKALDIFVPYLSPKLNEYLFSPIQDSLKDKNTILFRLDYDPVVIPVDITLQRKDTQNELFDVSTKVCIGGQILVHLNESSQNGDYLLNPTILSDFFYSWILSQWKPLNSTPQLNSVWNHMNYILNGLFEEYIFPSLSLYGTDLFTHFFDSAVKMEYAISPLALNLILRHSPVHDLEQWLEKHFLTRTDLFSLPVYIWEKVFSGVLSRTTLKTDQLSNQILKLIIEKSRTVNVKPEEFENLFGLWSSLSGSTMLSKPSVNLDTLFILLDTLTSKSSFEKFSVSLKTSVLRFTASLLNQFPNLVPTQDNKIWQQFWAIILSAIKQENFIKDKSKWAFYTELMKLLESLLNLIKNEDFSCSKYDTVIVDGVVVRGKVTDMGSTSPMSDWNTKQNEVLRILYRMFLMTTGSYSSAQQTLWNNISKLIIFAPEAVLTSIEQYDVLLYDAIKISNLEIQFSAFEILKKLIQIRNAKTSPVLENFKKDQISLGNSYDDKEEVPTILPLKLKNLIQTVTDLDENNQFPFVAQTIGWLLLTEYLNTKNGKERGDIGIYLRQKNIISKFLSVIFAHIKPTTPLPATLTTSTPIPNLCAFVYKQLVSSFPSFVRVWWGDLSNRSITQKVDTYTTKHISPAFIMDELSKIQAYNRESSMENKVDNTEFTSNLTPEGATFSVSCVRGSSNQVVATYKKDEVQATIVLALADNHPLRAVAINSSNRIGVNEATWRKWLLSMTTVLLTQDGSVLDAVLLWRSSLDNFLEGVELCPICYALFHSSNYSIPNLSCKTCKSKFHGACLYKWFHTSMKNECPMCKTLFN